MAKSSLLGVNLCLLEVEVENRSVPSFAHQSSSESWYQLRPGQETAEL